MDATVYNILSRSRRSSADFARPRQFTLDAGQTVRAQILLEEAAWTPFSVDDEQRLIYFVQCPTTLDLSTAAFVYTAQFEQAQVLLSISYENLIALKTAMKRPAKLIMIYSMGRCGTTLMSQILNQVDGVFSLSEPDIFTLLAYLRQEDGSRDAELVSLIEACTLMLQPQDAASTSLALKFRSNVISIADLFQSAFPDAHNLFMYRNALSWAKSVYGFLMRLSYPMTEPYPRENCINLYKGLTGGDPAYLEPYLPKEGESTYFTDLLVPAWASYLERYMKNYERGVRFHCLRYEELNAARESSLKAMLDYCGLPQSAVAVAMQAFEKDSQEGTDIARDIQIEGMSEQLISQFRAILAQHPKFNQADYQLPSKS